MRPKKKILIISNDEDFAGILAYTLVTTGLYRATQVSPTTPHFSPRNDEFELFIVDQSAAADLGVGMILRLKVMLPWVPVMLAYPVERGYVPFSTEADCVLPLPYNAADMLERLRFSTRRKRGPRRGSVRAPAPVLVDVHKAGAA